MHASEDKSVMLCAHPQGYSCDLSLNKNTACGGRRDGEKVGRGPGSVIRPHPVITVTSGPGQGVESRNMGIQKKQSLFIANR